MTSTSENHRPRRACWRAPLLALALPGLLAAQAAYLSPGPAPQLSEDRRDPPPPFERSPIDRSTTTAMPDERPEEWPEEVLPRPLAVAPVRTSLIIGLEAVRDDQQFRLVLGQELARASAIDIARQAGALETALGGLTTREALEAMPDALHRIEPLGTVPALGPDIVGPIYLTRTVVPVPEDTSRTTLISRIALTDQGQLRVVDRHLEMVDGVRIYAPPTPATDFYDLTYLDWFKAVD